MNHPPLQAKLLLATILGSMALAGCSSPEKDVDKAAKADFKDPLQLNNNELARPPSVLSEQGNLLLRAGSSGISRLLPELKQARIRRDGSVRWLEVDVPTEQAWPLVRSFWIDAGFDIAIDIPEAGFIETGWQQDYTQVIGTGLTRYLDIALSRINDTGIRNQFRSRIEQGATLGQSYIYVTHRAVEQGGIGTDGLFSPLPTDRILEVEMLRRLMLAFRLPEESIATLAAIVAEEDNDLYDLQGHILFIPRNRADAWRRLLLALDRGGFTVTNQDTEEGLITLLTADPTVRKEDIGFFNRLLQRGQDRGEPREVVLEVITLGPARVQVVAPANEEGASILKVLAEHL